MPAAPGENLLTTLFADVHYYFSDPSSKPQHHRFSRGSYVYLFQNPAENRAKIEIANHAGTPEQDAFSGYLNVANLTYSYKQPALFTVKIDGASVQDHEQWHLPSYNERNEQKYLYKINSLDLYLWTEKDAATLLGHLKSALPAEKLDIRDAPANLAKPAEHRDSMSPVVQQLERTAISPQFTPQRQQSTTSQTSFPGPPSAPSPQPATGGYNPAAPAAPEPIAHREKTPPPPDAESGTGLASAAKYDSLPQQQYANVPNTFGGPSQPTPQQSYFSGPPQQQRNPSTTSFPGPPTGGSGSLPPPPPPPGGQQQTPSFASPPPQQSQNMQPTSPPPNQQNFSPQPSFGAPIQQYATYPQQGHAPSFGPNAVASPGLPGSQQHQPPTYSGGPQQNPQAPYGYSNYNYAGGQGQQPQGYEQGGGYTGDIHSQVYRPTAEEANSHGHGAPQAPKQTSESRQRLEGRVRGVEAGVGKFLKKLDKRFP